MSGFNKLVPKSVAKFQSLFQKKNNSVKKMQK